MNYVHVQSSFAFVPFFLVYTCRWWGSHTCVGGGGELAYERGGEAYQKFWIKPLKETILHLVQAFFTPKRDQNKINIKYIFLYFLAYYPNRDLHG